MSAASIVFAAQAGVTFVLIVTGAVLIAIGAIDQAAFLALVSAGVGLIGGGGTAAVAARRDNGKP